MDVSYDKTNLGAYRHSQQVHGLVSTLCEPLVEYFGIQLFGYVRAFLDGRIFLISNQLGISEFLLQFALQGRVVAPESVTPLLHLNTAEQLMPLLWKTTPCTPILQGIHAQGFWNGISFAKMLPDSMEVWSFTGDRESSNMQEFYIRNYNAFSKFTQFFNMNAADIIKCDDKHRLGFYKYGYQVHDLPKEWFDGEETAIIDSFLDLLHKKSKCLHKIKPELTLLTRREKDCLKRLAKGETAREISQYFGLSPRTVETHLKSIKGKTGFRSRSQLVKFFLNHFN